MKTCPYCGYQNPDQRILCEQCSKRIGRENLLMRIISGFMFIVGGIGLIAADTVFDLAPGHLVPLPFALTIVGAIAIVAGIQKIAGSEGTSIPVLGRKQQHTNVDQSPRCPHCNRPVRFEGEGTHRWQVCDICGWHHHVE